MSSTDDGDDGPGNREVAHRLFAAEFDDVTVSYRESDEERAPNYVVTPTGARVNRLFAVGVLTEVESVNDGVVRARIADPTGVFVSYAGQYQPDALAFYERTDPPTFVALTGKARTFEPEDGDRIYSSVRPESVNEVDAGTRDRWVVNAAEATLERIAVMRDALAREERGDDLRAALEEAGVRESLAAGVPIAIERYGTTPAYLDAVRRVALDALAVVADERESVRPLDVAPDEGGAATVGPLPDVEDRADGIPDAAGTAADEGADATAGPTDTTDETIAAEGTGGATEPEPATAAESPTEPEPASTTETEPESTGDTGSAGGSEPETEPAVEPEQTADAGTSPAEAAAGEPTDGTAGSGEPAGEDELGDFEPDDAADVDTDEVYEMDEAERREVEEEYGTEFATGTEVDEPGEADIDVPEPETAEGESGVDGEPSAATSESTDGADTTDTEPADAADEGDSGAVDLEDAAVAAMESLDEGDGADHEAVVAAVVDEHGADPGAVEDAIQDALMSGRCYEPDEATLKPI